MLEQLEEALANGAGPFTASRQSELAPALKAAPSPHPRVPSSSSHSQHPEGSYVATKSEHEPQVGGFAPMQADSDQHEGVCVSTKPLSDRQVQEPSASQSASAASAQAGARLDQHSASAAEPASHATDQVIQKASDALRAKDKPAEAQSSAVVRQPAAVLGSAPHHPLPETDQTTSSANERAVSGVQADGEQPPSAVSVSSSQVTAVPSMPAKTTFSPAAMKANGGFATASVRSERLPSATLQGTANVPTATEFTAANITTVDTSAAEATAADVSAADPISATAQGTANAPSAVRAAETTAADLAAVNAAADTSAAESTAAESTAAGATAAHAQVAGSDATAAASDATADHSADSPAVTTGLTQTNADTSDGMPSATAGPAQGASSLSMQPAAGQPSDRAAASPQSPHAPSSGAPATANTAFALPRPAAQAEAVRISPVVISDSARAAASTDGDVEKPSSLASSRPDIAEADNASLFSQKTAMANSPVSIKRARAAAISPNSTDVAASKSPVTVKASQSFSEEEKQESGYAESRATPSFRTQRTSFRRCRGPDHNKQPLSPDQPPAGKASCNCRRCRGPGRTKQPLTRLWRRDKA